MRIAGIFAVAAGACRRSSANGSRTTLVPGVSAGRITLVPGVSAGGTTLVPGVSAAGRTTLAPGFSAGRTPLVPGVSTGRTTLLPGVFTSRSTLLPGVSTGRMSFGPGGFRSAPSRSFSVRGKQLPVLTQLSFVSDEDMKYDTFVSPAEYFEMVDILKEVKIQFLIPELTEKKYMGTKAGSKLLKDLLDLVFENKQRGYCIARCLTEENLEVSLYYGTFRIIDPVPDPIQVEARYRGYRAAKKLWVHLLVKRYTVQVLDELPADLSHLFNMLDAVCVKELVVTHHAFLLSPYGRISMAQRLEMMLRCELLVDPARIKDRNIIVTHLPYTGIDGAGIMETDRMHALFAYVRQTSVRLSKPSNDENRPPPPDPDRPDTCTALALGIWVTALNRHGIYHSMNKHASAVVLRSFYDKHPWLKRKKDLVPYDIFDLARLFHYKMPLYMPTAQVLIDDRKLTPTLGLRHFFPQKVVFRLPRRRS